VNVDVDVGPSPSDTSFTGAQPRDSVLTENYRGNLSYTLPVKYKVTIFVLAILSISLLIAVIAQGVNIRRLKRLTMLAEIDVDAEFENFIKLFKRNYTTPEERQEKFSIFASNIAVYDQMFRRTKVRPVRYFGKYSDMTNAEVAKRLGYNLEESINDSSRMRNITMTFNASNLLPQVNWKDRGFVSYAKD